MKVLLKKNKKNIIIVLSVFFFSLIGFILYFLFNGDESNKNVINNNDNNAIVKVLNKCTINQPYFSSSKINKTKNGLEGINIKIDIINNISSDKVVECILDEENKNIINSFNKPGYLLKDFFSYKIINPSKNKYILTYTGVKLDFIKNNKISIIKIDKDSKNNYLYFKDNPNIKKFIRDLKKINKSLSLGLKIDNKEIKGINKIKMRDVLTKFGEDSIVTNTKIIIKLSDLDFKLIKEKTNKEKDKLDIINILEDVSNIYNNTIVYKSKYIIIQDIARLINK